MAKPDFPSLLAPGIHVHTLASIAALAVVPFPGDLRRPVLFAQFGRWASVVQAANVSLRVWIDGSFLTSKPLPDDIDCVAWSPQFTQPPTPQLLQHLQQLFDRGAAKAQYGLDLYLEVPRDNQHAFERTAYWSGLMGFCHDRVTAKGIAEIRI
jgi:uncharacterized protein DUF6932